MAEFPIDERNRVRRLPERSRYDRDLIYQIIDEALYCHVAFVQDGQPFLIPITHARWDDTLFLHGSPANRLLRHVQAGEPVTVAVTVVDGLVLARSAFHHSINYRSVVLFGRGRLLTANEEKLRALEVVAEHVTPGRWKDVRPPSAQELKATSVVAIPIESASAKVRSGPPKDDAEDYGMSVWAGVLPLKLAPEEPVPDPQLAQGITAPDYIVHYSR
jgi:nitroimidazol reductase NimA-like FMN-containing flavoprotein (pyridoxamine 5'-phosphate oxidase superfamily)